MSFLTDFSMYLCISLMLSLCFSNLKKSSAYIIDFSFGQQNKLIMLKKYPNKLQYIKLWL